ncbi:DNA polymerase III subunit epsilon [Pelagibacteraceae bacterium]|nr:DNA polymerase III subunit epsilon [Pelagibacteraceae bacterium]
MSEIFLDTETTGLSFYDNHKIVEIACVETNDLVPTKNIFHKIINPEREVPKEAENIHGFSTELLKTKETFDKVVDEFVKFIDNKKIIIHNAPFDVGFLNYQLKLLRKNEIKKENVIDSLELARSKYPGSSNSLDALCKRFNISLLKRTKHNALLDCELLREVYINLLDVREPKMNFTSQNKTKLNDQNKIQYCKKVIKPKSSETELHKKFLSKEIKKNFY